MYNKPFVVSKKKGETFIKYYSGLISSYNLLAKIDENLEQIFVLPFCQARERGFSVRGEEKVLSLVVDNKREYSFKEFIETFQLRDTVLESNLQELFSEKKYKRIVKNIVEEEIGNGEGANFLIAQKLSGKIKSFDIEVALSLFRKILEIEQGYYLAFIFFDGEKVFIGASPERHVSVEGKKVRMNPISGTFRKLGYGNYLDFKKDFSSFLKDKKEINELFMASDEELKMMSNICSGGGLIVGPILKEMSHLVHTEYLLSGDSSMSKIDILKQSMWASTVIGSPIESAFKIVKKYEEDSRQYYGGAICHLDGDNLDSAIMIRTLQLDINGNLEIYVGASLVKDSNPESEYKELQAKIKGVMSAFDTRSTLASLSKSFTQDFYLDDEIQELLQKRNQYLSKVWFFKQEQELFKDVKIQNTILIIDNEDDFTSMLVHLLHMLGYKTQLYKSNEIQSKETLAERIGENTIVLIGPGPGNPLDDTKKNLINLETIDYLEKSNKKYFGICLGHQLICRYKHIELQKKSIPTQGEQLEIDLFGKKEKVGFYNTFSAFNNKFISNSFSAEEEDIIKDVEISSHNKTGEIYALRGKNFFSLQFHPESILSQNGLEILKENLGKLHHE